MVISFEAALRKLASKPGMSEGWARRMLAKIDRVRKLRRAIEGANCESLIVEAEKKEPDKAKLNELANAPPLFHATHERTADQDFSQALNIKCTACGHVQGPPCLEQFPSRSKNLETLNCIRTENHDGEHGAVCERCGARDER